MNRRHFLTLSGAAGLATLGTATTQAQAASGRQYLELQKYTFENEGQRAAFETYLQEAAIPALNRLGSQPVGVFFDLKEFSPAYVLIPHASVEAAAGATQKLLADAAYTAKAGDFIKGPKSAPPYKEVESWLMRAFSGMPKVETPVKGPNRVFQLRIYESPSVQTGQKKIEMFNDGGELKIFREVGLAPVFFGEVLFGAKLPNLTYMLGFESPEDMKAGWGRFGKHPEWQRLRTMPEYADSKVIRGITNTVLKPAAYSQI
jgi:hypothetical protein